MDEIWTAIIEKLRGDELLNRLVAQRIWYGLPRSEVTVFPAVRLLVIGDVPNTTVPGDYEVRLQVDVTAESASGAWPVVRGIELVLRHPTRENPGPIESETHWVRGALPRTTVAVASSRENPRGGGGLVQLSTDWTLKITRKD